MDPSRNIPIVTLSDGLRNALAKPTPNEKLDKAKAYLGTRYIRHPEYQFDPRHSTHRETYELARAGYLLSISMAGLEARQRNPLFQTHLNRQAYFLQEQTNASHVYPNQPGRSSSAGRFHGRFL